MSRKSGTRRSGVVPKGKLASKFDELYSTSLKLAPTKIRGEDGLLTFESFLRTMYQDNKSKNNNINIVEESSSDESDYAFLYDYDSDGETSQSPTAKKLFAENEKPALYYAKPPGLNENKTRELRIEPESELNDFAAFENDSNLDAYIDEVPFHEEPKQSKKDKTNKSKPVEAYDDSEDHEPSIQEDPVPSKKGRGKKSSSDEEILDKVNDMRPTSQKEQTPKKAGRGKKTKVVEEIIPDTYDENMTMEIEDLPEEPQPKRGKTKKTNVLSQIENVDAPKKSKRGAKTLEKPQEIVQKSKNKRPAAEEPVTKPDTKKRRQSILVPQSKTYALDDKRANLSPTQWKNVKSKRTKKPQAAIKVLERRENGISPHSYSR